MSNKTLFSTESIPDEDQVDLSEIGEATYQVILPTLSALGLAGNFLCIVVLMGRRFRRHASYVYLRSLAWADSAYLVLTLQICMNVNHFKLLGAPVHESSNSYGFEVYLVKYVGFLNNSLGTTSDVFILLMTIDRFNLLSNVEKLDGGARKGWIIRFELFLALIFCVSCHVPMTFQHEIYKCEEYDAQNIFSTTTPASTSSNCYVVTHFHLGEDPLWHVYVVTVQIVLRILPTVAIFGFNIWIYFKLRGISRRRRRFKQQRQSRRVRDARLRTKKPGTASTATTNNQQVEIPTIVVDPPPPEVSPADNSLSPEANKVRSALGVTLSAEAALSAASVGSDDIVSLEPSSDRSAETESDSGQQQQLKRARWKTKWMGKVGKLRLVPRLTTREIRTSQLVLFIAATHVFLATPANVLFIVYLYDQTDEDDGGLSESLVCLTHTLLVLNYSVNFLLYCVGNRNVREAAFQLLFRCKHIYWVDWQMK